MYRTRKRISICSLSLACLLFAETSRADFFDWITGREPTPWSRTQEPLTTNRGFAWRPLTTATMPTTVNSTPQAVTNYVPVTRYRTQWVQVPVTTYRPAFQTNPATGLPQLQMRACQRQVWQVRRVPVTTMRPTGSCGPLGIMPWCWNWNPMVNNCCVPQYAAPATVTSQPYYSGPDSLQPSPAPVTGQPLEPADQVPTLPQSTTPQTNATPAPAPSTGVSRSQGSSVLRPPVQDRRPNLQPSQPRTTAPEKTEPIPDLDRQPLLQHQGPNLLNPLDRTTRSLLPVDKDARAVQWASLLQTIPQKTPPATPSNPRFIHQPVENPPAALPWNRVQP